MSLSTIFSAIPDDVKRDFANNVLHRVGNLIIDENDAIQGFLQSSLGFVGKEGIEKAVSFAAQYAEVGISANPIAMGVHAAGSFGVIAYQMDDIKNRLEKVEQQLNKINAKVDIGYYSKFKAAIELGSHAFSMKNEENKMSMAHKAVQLFVETKNIYTEYIEQELESDGRMLSEYLLIVILSYIGQVKCCLELEEIETAQKILKESASKIKSLTEKYAELLLSNNPAIYLHNDFKDLDIDLRRITKVYNWLGEETNENDVFNKLREQYIEVHTNQEKSIREIPKIIWDPSLDIETKIDNSYLGRLNPIAMFQSEDNKPFLKERLKESFETIEKVMEAYDRYSSIKYEVEMLSNAGISYESWQKSLNEQVNSENPLMYIALENPIEFKR